jgi:hypothetical protein
MGVSVELFYFLGGKMTAEMIKAIEAILKRGNDAEVRRRGGGVVVLEVKKEIKYTTPV